MRSTVSRMLKELGYETVVVDSEVGGLRALAAEPSAIRLVMLDLTMPSMAARDMLARLRETNSAVPVLLMSGYQQEEVAGLLGQPGVVGFLQKPLHLEALQRALRRAQLI